MRNSPLLDKSGSGPVLGAGRRGRRGGWSLPALLLGGLAALGAYQLWSVIGRDLDAGTHVNAPHRAASEDTTLPSSAVAAVGPLVAAPSAPALIPAPGSPPEALGRGRAEVQVDGAARTLLAAARDHLARKVTPTVWSVEDLRANSGNHLDLLERGLSEHISIKSALIRHRSRNPVLYGLAAKPNSTIDERRRAWSADNLEVFFTAFADDRGVSDPADLLAGDIVIVRRKKGSARHLAAVVSDVADEAGNPQVVVMDPAEHSPKEASLKTSYILLSHFRVTTQTVEHIRQSLDLGPRRAPVGLTL